MKERFTQPHGDTGRARSTRKVQRGNLENSETQVMQAAVLAENPIFLENNYWSDSCWDSCGMGHTWGTAEAAPVAPARCPRRRTRQKEHKEDRETSRGGKTEISASSGCLWDPSWPLPAQWGFPFLTCQNFEQVWRNDQLAHVNVINNALLLKSSFSQTFCPLQICLIQKVARDTIHDTPCLSQVLPFLYTTLYLPHSQQLCHTVLNPAKLLTSTVAKKNPKKPWQKPLLKS